MQTNSHYMGNSHEKRDRDKPKYVFRWRMNWIATALNRAFSENLELHEISFKIRAAAKIAAQ